MTSPTPSPISDQAAGAPIPMLLFCPKCHSQHIDSPKWERDPHDVEQGLICTWSNPPHKSHLCHACGNIWRPADVATTGVVCIQTRGKADTWGSTAPTTGSAPDGYALVPVRMTADMINAWSGGRTVSYDEVAYRTTFQDAWKRVLEAAPASPAASVLTFLKVGTTERGSAINAAMQFADQTGFTRGKFKWCSAYADALVRTLAASMGGDRK